jgi:hypothetical protein
LERFGLPLLNYYQQHLLKREQVIACVFSLHLSSVSYQLYYCLTALPVADADNTPCPVIDYPAGRYREVCFEMISESCVTLE